MANDPTCLPPCAPNATGDLPVLPATPGAPVPVIVATCDPLVTTTVDATGPVRIVQANTDALRVVICEPAPEFDKQILCAPDGTRVIAVIDYNVTGVPTAAFYTLTGAIYADDPELLTDCVSGEESDELAWCLNGANVTQWIVKLNGEPTGDVYWTNAAGAIVAAPVGATRGICNNTYDIEWIDLCDLTGGLSVPFKRRVLNNIAQDGAVTTTLVDFRPDMVTTYVVTGIVVDCSSCSDLPARGLQPNWNGIGDIDASCVYASTVVGCYTDALGASQSVVIHYMNDNKGIPAVRITDLSGDVVVLATEANTTIGICSLPIVNVRTEAKQIAGALRAATPQFLGAATGFNTSNATDFPVAAKLQSITVVGRSIVDGLPGLTTDQITVSMSSTPATIALMDGETRTFSVVKDTDEQLEPIFSISASGNAYATVTCTYIM